jgi:hypothetical protein
MKTQYDSIGRLLTRKPVPGKTYGTYHGIAP